MEEGPESLQEPNVREDWSERVSPGHGRTTASMQLIAAAVVCTRPAHDPASPHSTCVGMRPPLLTEE